MKINQLLSVIPIFGIVMTISCKHDPVQTKYFPNDTITEPPVDTIICDSTNVTYNNTIFPILDAYCISCHSGATPAGALNFNNYEDVSFIAQSGQLIGTIKHLEGYSPMPQYGDKISECEIALIEKWINDTTFTTPPDTTECDTLNITYPGTIYSIFESNCLSCHSPPTPEGGIDLTNYEHVSFLAQNGSLLGSIKHLPDYSSMPKNAPPLSNCEIKQIEMWINDTTFASGNEGIPCDPDTVYFQNDILPLFQSSCGISGCHDPITAESEVILTSYYYVMQTADVQPGEPGESDIIEVINKTNPDDRMPPPPAAPLTQDQKDMIYTWILQGALDNYCDVEDCDTLIVTYSETIFPIIQNSCYGCHSGADPGGGILLTNYSQISAAAAIDPGNSGSLVGSITWSSGNIPMPQNGPQLSDCKIKQINKWINDGMPDN